MKKRILAMSYAIIMIGTLLPLSAAADDYESTFMTNTISCGAGGAEVPSAAIKEDGSVWIWGSGEFGLWGDGNGKATWSSMASLGGDPQVFEIPTKVMDNVESVSGTAVIKKDGTLWTWGKNVYGEAGTGTIHDGRIHGTTGSPMVWCYFNEPTMILENMASVSSSSLITMAVTDNHELWGWGSNQNGLLGISGGNDVDSFGLPIQTVPVKLMDDVVSVASNSFDSAAMKTDGSLWVWGNNKKPAELLDDVKSVSIGGFHAAAVKKDSTLWMWGDNGYGQIGVSGQKQDKPVKVMDHVASVSLGGFHTAALKTDGTLWTWGMNWYGQLGTGKTDWSVSTPQKVMDDVVAVSAAGDITMALKKDGSLYTWGSASCGALGNGGAHNSYSYQDIKDGTSLHPCQTTPVKIMDHVMLPNAGSTVPSEWAQREVSAAIQANLVPEYQQARYTRSISRSNAADLFIQLIEEASGKTIDAFLQEKGVAVNHGAFQDCSDPSVLAANALGIIQGVGNNRFDPYGTLTRSQIAAIINRIAKVLDVQTVGYTHSFTDVSGHWVDSELGWPVHAKIIEGVGNNKFDPNGKLTVEQAIIIAYRALQVLK